MHEQAMDMNVPPQSAQPEDQLLLHEMQNRLEMSEKAASHHREQSMMFERIAAACRAGIGQIAPDQQNQVKVTSVPTYGNTYS